MSFSCHSASVFGRGAAFFASEAIFSAVDFEDEEEDEDDEAEEEAEERKACWIEQVVE